MSQFRLLETTGQQSAHLRREHLMSESSRLCVIKSNRTCLYCIHRGAEHRPVCGHSLCDNCTMLYGEPATDVEYRFTVSLCHLCLSRVPLVVDILPPTMHPSVIGIDGGGVRGGIPIEFLMLVQESLGPECPLQILVDLAVGVSSGRCLSMP